MKEGKYIMGQRLRRAFQLKEHIIPNLKSDVKRINKLAKSKLETLRERVKQLQEIESILEHEVSFEDYLKSLKDMPKGNPKMKFPKSWGIKE